MLVSVSQIEIKQYKGEKFELTNDGTGDNYNPRQGDWG